MSKHVAVDDKKIDARVRAMRTLWTSLGVDLTVAIGFILTDWIVTADITQTEAWIALGILVARSVVTSVASFMVRLKVTPSNA